MSFQFVTAPPSPDVPSTTTGVLDSIPVTTVGTCNLLLTRLATVPGAWHIAEVFDPLAAALKKSGYDAHTVPLVSVGAKEPLEGFEPDVELVQKTVQQYLDEGKDVVLVMHSYGGTVGQQAAGFLKESKGKLVSMVWLCAFALQAGQTLMGMLGGNPLPWFIVKVQRSN